MASIKFLTLFILFIFNSYALNELPELFTKQNIEKIKFISKDGRYVYYQEAIGDLVLASNFSTKDILKGNKNSFHLLRSSLARKKIIIETINNYHQSNTLVKNNKLSVMDFDGSNLTEIGEGTNAKLHLQDTWISYYKPLERVIVFNSLQIKNLTFTIKLQNKINPYFIPEVEMYNLNFVLYTDINDEGISAILQYERNTKKIEIVHKTTQNGIKIELCLKNSTILIGQFPLSDTIKQASIHSLNSNGEMSSKSMKPLYESKTADMGNMVCDLEDNNLYFVQASADFKKFSTQESEIVALNLSDKKIEILTKLDYANQMVSMDGNLFLSWRGKYFIIKGDNTLRQDSLKQQQQPEAKKEAEVAPWLNCSFY